MGFAFAQAYPAYAKLNFAYYTLYERQEELLLIRIVEINDSLMTKASRLVAKVFPFRSLSERLTFWAFKHRMNIFVSKTINKFGIAELINFWVAVDENSNVVGTTGIYSYRKDKEEAIWLAWFCVDPEQRGKGIGKKLLEFSLDIAKKCNKKYFRLYTSSDPNEAAAQFIYEKYGFKIVKKEKRLFYTKIYRERAL